MTEQATGLPTELPKEGLLRWRCRRGMRELDAALVAYLDNHYSEAAWDEKAAFCALLDMPDPDIMRLVAGQPSANNATLPEPESGPFSSAPKTAPKTAPKSAPKSTAKTELKSTMQGSNCDGINQEPVITPIDGALESNPYFVGIVEKIRTTLTA